MNGRNAKVIRRAVYGDMALRQVREYRRVSMTGQIVNKPGSLRAEYKRVKKKMKGN